MATTTPQVLSDQARRLLANASPQALNTLMTRLGLALRKSQQARIRAQQNPDGSAFEPRRQRRQGKRKNRMFQRLVTARHLRQRTQRGQLRLGFLGRTAGIARVHQQGLRERWGQREVVYPQRQLLGFSDQDLALLEDLIIEHLKEFNH